MLKAIARWVLKEELAEARQLYHNERMAHADTRRQYRRTTIALDKEKSERKADYISYGNTLRLIQNGTLDRALAEQEHDSFKAMLANNNARLNLPSNEDKEPTDAPT